MSKPYPHTLLKASFVLAFLLSAPVLMAQYVLLKTHLAQLPFGQVGLGVEKVFDRQFSLQLNAQYLIPDRGRNFINRNFIAEDELDKSLLQGYALSLESRAYTIEARSEAWKWYLGLFLRYSNYETNSTFTQNELDREFEGRLSSTSGGLELGINYIYRNKFSFDLCFMGVGFARNTLEARLITEEAEPNIGQLEDDLRNIPILGSRIILNRNEEGILEYREDYGTLAIRFAFTVGLIL